MYPNDASTVSNKRTGTPEPEGRVLRPRKRVKYDYKVVERTPPSRSSRKRRKVPARFRKVPGVFAFLARLLTDVPVEVVYLEIFCYLDTRDLLVLSRSCKLLREILFTKDPTVESIWRTARLNVIGSLPPLPTDLNEPQYAHLIFDAECDICDKSSRCNIVLWKFRLRCCRDCLTTFRIFNWLSFYDELYPFTSFDIISQERVRVPGKDHDVFIVNFQEAEDLRAEFMTLESEEQRQSWLIQKREKQAAVVQHARLCEEWHKGELERRTAQVNTCRTERLQAILSRLDVIGLRREADMIIDGRSNLMNPKDFTDLSCVKQPKELTDYGWARIKSKLTQMLSDHRTTRLAQQNYSRLKKEYFEYLSHQDLREIYPGLGDILTDPVIETSLWDTELEEGLTSLSIQTLLSGFLDRFLRNWRQSSAEELLVIFRKARPAASLKDLYLATTIFGCAKCNTLLICPQVFYHSCCFQNHAHNNQSHDRMRKLNAEYHQDGPWSSSSLFFHSKSSELAERIVIGAGLNPTTATVRDLTFAQPVIECTGSQADQFPERLFVTWAAALTYNLADDDVHFVINRNVDETSRIRAREPLSMCLKTVCCVRCHAEVTPKSFIRHLNVVHNLDYRPPMDSASRAFYLLHDSHWYWNPRRNLDSIGMDFRW